MSETIRGYYALEVRPGVLSADGSTVGVPAGTPPEDGRAIWEERARRLAAEGWRLVAHGPSPYPGFIAYEFERGTPGG
jgi:hypothetical protein